MMTSIHTAMRVLLCDRCETYQRVNVYPGNNLRNIAAKIGWYTDGAMLTFCPECLSDIDWHRTFAETLAEADDAPRT